MIIIIISLLSILFSNTNIYLEKSEEYAEDSMKNRIDYIADESGNILMSLNILGHVKKPGTVIVSQDATILDLISAANGTLQGAKLNNIIVYRENSEVLKINLNSYMNSGNYSDFVFKPNDTIYIKENFSSYLLSSLPLINTMISITNLYLLLLNIN